MLVYIIRRLIQTLITTFVVISIIFMLIHILPGDPALTILGGLAGTPTDEQVQLVRERLGLDLPIGTQYLRYIGKLLQGDLGVSFVTGRPVVTDIMLRVPRTLQIVVPAIILAALIGIPLGVFASTHRGKITDFMISTSSVLAFSLPSFVSGLLLVGVFSIYFNYLPSGGYVSPSKDFGAFISRIILPVITLTAGPVGMTMRMTRSSTLEQLGLDYVTTALAKGVADKIVVYRHVLRNSLIPVVTSLGLQAGVMFAGSVIVENLFNWPGISTLLLQSVLDRDYPIIQGVILVVSLVFILINLMTDLIYGFIDPRIRYD
jgi:peptide/nickel transport system permease protein